MAQVSGKSVAWILHLLLASTLKLSIRSVDIFFFHAIISFDLLEGTLSILVLLWFHIRHCANLVCSF